MSGVKMGNHAKRKSWLERKQRFAAKLNLKPAASERWFFTEWVRMRMADDGDMANEVFVGFIPDVVNHSFRYVIEVDGSIHSLPRVKRRDVMKDKAYSRAGYSVFRLKAYDEEGLALLADEISKLRVARRHGGGGKTILRKQMTHINNS